MSKFYDWQKTFSRQTGNQGEFCIVIGAKGIGKTFGLRKQCINDFLKRGTRFCEICRTKTEMQATKEKYFDKLQTENLFKDYIFKVAGQTGYIAKNPGINEETGKYLKKPNWKILCYFVALTNFQTEKKRTYANITRFIFDEGIIDKKDKYHRYLYDEYEILANLLDSISREQPNQQLKYRVYMLGNACDLACPYFRYFGINKIPDFGYTFYNHKNVLLHYVPPIDRQERESQTLVGRMLRGNSEAEMIFGNKFNTQATGDICKKSSHAKFKYAVKFNNNYFSFWMDYLDGLCWVSDKIPKGETNIYALTKDDTTIDYIALPRNSEYLKLINRFWYSGCLRFESAIIREKFLTILEYFGIR